MKQLTYEGRIQLLALAAASRFADCLILLCRRAAFPASAFWTLAFLIISLWLGFAFSLRSRVSSPANTFDLLAALRERIFRFALAAHASDDAWAK